MCFAGHKTPVMAARTDRVLNGFPPSIYMPLTGGDRHPWSVPVPDQDGYGMETSRSLILFINYYLIISL